MSGSNIVCFGDIAIPAGEKARSSETSDAGTASTQLATLCNIGKLEVFFQNFKTSNASGMNMHERLILC